MYKIKVALFADILVADFDGAARTMFQIFSRIPNNEFDFLFVCGMGPDRISGFKCLHVSTMAVPGNRNYKIAIPMLQRADLDKKIDDFAPDVIHIATPSLLGNYALRTSARLGLSVISIYHTNFVGYVDYYMKYLPFLIDFTRNRAKDLLKNFYNQCDMVYVPSAAMMNELKFFGVRNDVLKLWQRGIDTNQFSPAKRNAALMRSITGNFNLCILFASRLVWEKNLSALADLYSLAEKCKLPYNFVVAGDGAAKDEIMRQMPRAHFLGHLPHGQLAEIYASCDVFFFPSVTETFGNVVLEAMASGPPCVVADRGGSSDFIEDGTNGYRCTPDDVHAFLNRIIKILKNPVLAKHLTDNALKTAKKYVWENLVEEYFEDLRDLAGLKFMKKAG